MRITTNNHQSEGFEVLDVDLMFSLFLSSYGGSWGVCPSRKCRAGIASSVPCIFFFFLRRDFFSSGLATGLHIEMSKWNPAKRWLYSQKSTQKKVKEKREGKEERRKEKKKTEKSWD